MRIRKKLISILSINEPPHRLAAAFALGVFWGMSPLLGLHTVLGIGVSWMLRLNKFVTIVGVYVTNPWTIVPIYTFATWIGSLLLGVDDIIPDIDWHNVNYKMMIDELRPLLWPFVVGSTVVGTVSAIISFLIVYYAAKRKKHE
ncbi:MAG: DUF2062 domain-containing protein [Nitrospiraceae bacterium]|nr:DUF2062 domain-containing protein [Nitrospiraceae bacterium]